MSQFLGATIVKSKNMFLKKHQINLAANSQQLKTHQLGVSDLPLEIDLKNPLQLPDTSSVTDCSPNVINSSRAITSHQLRSNASFILATAQGDTRASRHGGLSDPYKKVSHLYETADSLGTQNYLNINILRDQIGFKRDKGDPRRPSYLPLENSAVKNKVKAHSANTRPQTGSPQKKRLTSAMLNYGIMMKNRADYNNYLIQNLKATRQQVQNQLMREKKISKQLLLKGTVTHKIEKTPSKTMIYIKDQAKHPLNEDSVCSLEEEPNERLKSSISHNTITNQLEAFNQFALEAALWTNKNRIPQHVSHILLSDFLQSQAPQHKPIVIPSPDRFEKVKQLARGGSGFSLTRHKMQLRERLKDLASTKQDSYTIQLQNTTQIIDTKSLTEEKETI